MAPPPSADLPLAERVMKLANTLQFAWFLGHLSLLVSVAVYSWKFLFMNYYSTGAQIAYRVCFASAASTYGIVVYKTWRARQRNKAQTPTILGYLSEENVQYLLMAIVWLFMPQYSIATLPYAIYSTFHFLTYTRTNLIPTLSPPTSTTPVAPVEGASPGNTPAAKQQQHQVAEAIGHFVKGYYDMSMSIVSGLEISLWFRLLLAALFMQRRSWILAVVYTAFLRARFSQSAHVKNSFAQLEARGDNLAGTQGMHPLVRQGWSGLKSGVRQFYVHSNLTQYFGDAPAPKKTS